MHRLAILLYERAYQARLRFRTGDDNRLEHEPIVLSNAMRICWRSGPERASGLPFSLSELRVALAVSLLHDLESIPRVSEEMIRDAERRGEDPEVTRLREVKATRAPCPHAAWCRGRLGAALRCPVPPQRRRNSAERRAHRPARHLEARLGLPRIDRLAGRLLRRSRCVWPLFGHPKLGDFGPLADLERKGMSDPTRALLRDQAQSNLHTLRACRANFDCTVEQFHDDDTTMRTTEGNMILLELRDYWAI